jgi:Zn-dependent protease
MNEVPSPPPVIETPTQAPPVMAPAPVAPPQPPKNAFQRAWTAFVAFIAATWKFAYPVFKLAKAGKLLLTAGTMFLSVAFYSREFGWTFALGFVVCIFIHEMGHVFAAWRLGLPVSTPIFIPGMGALILSKRMGKSAWEGAVMGFGGPLFGTLAGFACWAIYGLTGNALFLGLALIGFIMNLFNMIPMFPLDGGWIMGAVSPYIWIAGLVGLVGLSFFTGFHNPFIWILIVLSLPRIWTSLKRGTADTTEIRTTSKQRVIAGLAYVGLCAVLMLAIAGTVGGTLAHRQARRHVVVQ